MHVDSHYAATLEHQPTYESLDGDVVCETCVIGAGFAGLTTARELAKAGQRVCLIEADLVGFGATGRNGGFVSAGFARGIDSIAHAIGWDHTRQLYDLSVKGRDYVRNTISDLGVDHLILGEGWLKILRHKNKDELTQLNQFMQDKIGVTQQFIDQDQLQQYARSERYHAALLDKDAFHIQPLAYAYALAGDLVEQGGEIYERTRAIAIEKNRENKSGLWKIRTRSGAVYCRHVVVCTSAYNGPSKRLNSSMVPVATYVVSSKPDARLLDESIPFAGCISDTRRSGDYYRTIGKGDQRRLVWGGRITTMRSQPQKLSRMLKKDMLDVYPQFTELEIERAWSGLMGYSSHQMPIIAEPEEGLWLASAFGGHGLNTTAMAGLILSEAIAGIDNKLQLFKPFGLNWSGGLFGRMAVQFEYWRLQYLDRRDEA